MVNKVLLDTFGRPILHHGDIADAMFAMSEAAMAISDVNLARLLDAGACEFQKKHDEWLKIHSKPANVRKHDLYETGDLDAPEYIKDRNGEVVLDLCRRCNRAEVDLDSSPVCVEI